MTDNHSIILLEIVKHWQSCKQVLPSPAALYCSVYFTRLSPFLIRAPPTQVGHAIQSFCTTSSKFLEISRVLQQEAAARFWSKEHTERIVPHLTFHAWWRCSTSWPAVTKSVLIANSLSGLYRNKLRKENCIHSSIRSIRLNNGLRKPNKNS